MGCNYLFLLLTYDFLRAGTRIYIPLHHTYIVGCNYIFLPLTSALSRAETSNNISQYLWDAITCPCHWWPSIFFFRSRGVTCFSRTECYGWSIEGSTPYPWTNTRSREPSFNVYNLIQGVGIGSRTTLSCRNLNKHSTLITICFKFWIVFLFYIWKTL